MSNNRYMNTVTIPGRNDGIFVSGDFLLRHMVKAICRDGMANWFLCCLSGVRIQDMTESLPRVINLTPFHFPWSLSW